MPINGQEMQNKLKEYISRRNAIIGLGGASAAIIAVTAATEPKGTKTVVGKIDPKNVIDLGDDFYLADGWVLSKNDIKHLNVNKD